MSGWSREVLVRAGVVVIVSLGVGFSLGALVGRAPPAPPSATPAAPTVTPEVLAFLAPLAVGSEVGGYRVTRIRAVADGVLVVELSRGAETTRVDVAKLGGAEAPATFGDYGVYYGKGVSAEDGEALAKAVASALASAGARRPPAGMGTLRGAAPL